MSDNKAGETMPKEPMMMPPLVPDDAPAAAKKMHAEEERPAGGDTLAARVAADKLEEDGRAHASAADPPKHM